MEQEMEKRERDDDHHQTGQSSDAADKWVRDSSVDYKGRVPLRASTGSWKAALFIITIEFSERLSYFGLAINLISYLTRELHQDLKTAAKNVNYWIGVTTIMPLIGGFIADAYTGRFTMILFSSLIYILGLSLLTMTQFIPSLKACEVDKCEKPRKIHEMVFWLALYCVSVGTGGHKPCLESFGADQFDDGHLEERKKKMSYFNWWNIALCCGLVLGVTVIAYIQDNQGWCFADLILTIAMAVSIATFFAGRHYYRYRVPQGSTLTPLLHVFVAAIRKRNLPLPSSPSLLYEAPKSRGRILCHTSRLRFLDKAAIIEDRDHIPIQETHNPWRLATVTKVEELKLLLNVIPIWLSSIIFGLSIASASTFFIKQAAATNRKISHNFSLPPASFACLGAISMLLSVTVYEKILVPILRRVTGNERGIKILPRIGIGMLLTLVGFVIAAFVERERLRAVEEGIGQSMSVFWLAPQYIIIGFGDGFTLVGLQEYFYDQVPDSMRSLGIAFYLSVIGVGNFLSSLLIIMVDQFTGKGWIGKDLNSSRLDNFYWLISALSGFNLCIYALIARRYTYKYVQQAKVVGDCSQEKDGIELIP